MNDYDKIVWRFRRAIKLIDMLTSQIRDIRLAIFGHDFTINNRLLHPKILQIIHHNIIGRIAFAQ